MGLTFLGVAVAAIFGTSAYRRASRTSCLGLDVDPLAAKIAAIRRAADLTQAIDGGQPTLRERELDVAAVLAASEEDTANAVVIEREAIASLGTPAFASRLGVDEGCLAATALVVADPSLCTRGAAPPAFSGRCRDFITRRLRHVVIVDANQRSAWIDLDSNTTKRTGEHPMPGVRFVPR